MKEGLYILAFDHRGSFIKGLLGIEGREPSDEELDKAKELKRIIYFGFEKAKISKDNAAVLVDEWLGAEILDDAQNEEYIVCAPVEKSGQKEFEFEYTDFKKYIEKREPDYVKVLVRYNPSGDEEMNKRQVEKLAALSSFLKESSSKFLLEMLVPPTASQEGDDYENKVRPGLVFKAVSELHAAGVYPAIWKIEGMDKTSDMQKVADKIDENDPEAKIVILGRGESKEHAEKWLKAGAKVDAAIGFAIGRTIFFKALEEYLAGTISKEEAVEKIKNNYVHFVEVWEKAKSF